MNWFLGHMHWNWCWRSGGCYSNLTETERLSWDISEIWAGKIHLIIIILFFLIFFHPWYPQTFRYLKVFPWFHHFWYGTLQALNVWGERDGGLWYSVIYCMMNTFIRDHCSVTSVVVQLEWERSAVWILVVTDVF